MVLANEGAAHLAARRIELLAESRLRPKRAGKGRELSPVIEGLIGDSEPIRWPGAVRELETMLERLAVCAGDGGVITVAQAQPETFLDLIKLLDLRLGSLTICSRSPAD